MTDKPIIFSGPMVCGLLDGRKTQTRRVLKPQPPCDEETGRPYSGTVHGPEWYAPALVDKHGEQYPGPEVFGIYGEDWGIKVPYAPGDRLYVREAWNCFVFSQDGEEAWPTEKIPTRAEFLDCKEEAYRFDMQPVYRESDRARQWFKVQPWRSPIHMPRWASRLTLTVTEVRVQRLQDISEEDALAEGILRTPTGHFDYHEHAEIRFTKAVGAYADLWNSLHGTDAWNANPWVVAVSFTVERRNIDAGGAGA